MGSGLLLYASSQYWTMYASQQDLEIEWQQQGSGNMFARDPDGGGPLTHLQIPRIKLDAMVVEGTSHKQLLAGPGHLAHTAQPGETGNAVITAHRDTFFRHIHELEEGDVIVVERKGQTFQYRVTGKRIVKPEEVSVIAPTNDAQLTLITCYPTYYIGPAPERLIVFSKLVP